MKFSDEIKSGIVVMAALLITVIFLGKTTDFQKKTYELKTYFNYAGDLKIDAVVKLSGIEVGRLKKTNFIYEPETKVECILVINNSAKIRRDSIAYIGTQGVIGDAYIGITAGGADEFFEQDGIIQSEDPVEMRVLMKKADSIASNLSHILNEAKSLVVDNRQNLDNIISNLETTSGNFKEFSEDVKKNPWKLMFKPE